MTTCQYCLSAFGESQYRSNSKPAMSQRNLVYISTHVLMKRAQAKGQLIRISNRRRQPKLWMGGHRSKSQRKGSGSATMIVYVYWLIVDTFFWFFWVASVSICCTKGSSWSWRRPIGRLRGSSTRPTLQKKQHRWRQKRICLGHQIGKD